MAGWVDRRPPGGFPHCVLDASRSRATPGRWYRGATVGPPGFEDPCYAHESSVTDLARQLGWVSPYQRGLMEGEISKVAAQVTDLRAQLDQARAQLRAVGVLTAGGFQFGDSDPPEPPMPPSTPAPVDADEQARQQRIRDARLEALARGRAKAAANRAARATQSEAVS